MGEGVGVKVGVLVGVLVAVMVGVDDGITVGGVSANGNAPIPAHGLPAARL